LFLNPKKAIEEGWLKGISEEFIQPNAVDIPVNALYRISHDSPFYLLQDNKIHRQRKQVKVRKFSMATPVDLQDTDLWRLDPGTYDYVSDAYVEMPENTVGWIITRSTLNRNGVFVISGLYDSGFKGHLNGTIYVISGTTYIQPGSRVGQFLMAESDSEGLYAGGYNTSQGEMPKQIQETV